MERNISESVAEVMLWCHFGCLVLKPAPNIQFERRHFITPLGGFKICADEKDTNADKNKSPK
jgi:hypothetical protein